jgi:antirestriction protein
MDVSNSDDLIDSRDVIERLEELASAWMAFQNDGADALDDDELAELKALTELAEEASGYAADWHYGQTLIRDSYFVTYAQELADDIGAVSDSATWPNYCIDWEWAARELRQDYTSVDFDGVTYWIR